MNLKKRGDATNKPIQSGTTINLKPLLFIFKVEFLFKTRSLRNQTWQKEVRIQFSIRALLHRILVMLHPKNANFWIRRKIQSKSRWMTGVLPLVQKN